MMTSLKGSHACTARVPVFNHVAGLHQPTPSPARDSYTHGQVQDSLLWCHCSFLLGPGAQITPRVYFLVLCKFWQLYDGVNGDLLQEDLCHTHSQSPCALTLPERSFWWSRMVTALFFHKIVEWTLTVGNWSEEPKVTPCWNCFFGLLVVAIVIIIIHHGLPQKTLPFSLTANVPFLSSQGDKLTLPSYEKKKLTHTFQRLAHWDVLQDRKSFVL